MSFNEEIRLPSSSSPSAAASAIMAGFGIAYVLFIVAIVVIGLVINWQIARKAGYRPAYSLLMLIPFVNFIVILIFAFSRWPVEEERDRMRAMGIAHATAPVIP
jgi:hypothetical protein